MECVYRNSLILNYHDADIHVLMMACYLVGHSYEVGIVYICYWQTISCLMVICGLRITNSSFGVIWDVCLIWIRSDYKFTNAYSNTWNEIRFSWYGYWLNMPCKLEFISMAIHWQLQHWLLNMQIVNAMGDTVVTVKDSISLMVTMMAIDGQVR